MNYFILVKTYKAIEKPENLIELSAESKELLLCKQVLNPLNIDYVQFIFDNFKPDWLHEHNKELFEIVRSYWEKFESIPSKKTMELLFKNDKHKAREAELNAEYNKIISFNEKDLDPKLVKNALMSFIKSKNVYFAILDNVNNIENKNVIDELIFRFEKIVQLDVSDDLGVEYFENFDKHCEDLKKKNTSMPFGFKFLDYYTNGGLPMKETCLFIIMAKPGFGKSQFMMNIAANWIKNNKKVLIVSLEMSEHMYSKRMDGIFTNLNINALSDNIDTLRSRIKGFKANIPGALLQLKEFPTGTLTPAMLKQYLKKLKQQTGFEPDIIFIDYLNIMKPNGSNAGSLSLYEKCGRISEGLRAISSEMKIPIVSAVQQNRGANGYAGENVDMSNVSESSTIAATADGIIALYADDGDRELGRKKVKILKNRFGKGVGETIALKEDKESLKMEDWDESLSMNDDNLGEVEEATEIKASKKQDASIIDVEADKSMSSLEQL